VQKSLKQDRYLFTFAESNILNTHNHEFKKNSQLTTDTQEDILYKHCETTGKAELQAIRQIKEYLEKLNREHELSDQACRELKQLSKEIDKFVADCKKEKSRRNINAIICFFLPKTPMRLTDGPKR